MTQSRPKNLLWQWGPVVFWLAVIMVESTDWLSSNHTGGFLLSLLRAIFGKINRAVFDIFHLLLRKTGHFVGYGIMSLLFFRALRATVTQRLGSLWWLSVLFTGMVASLDEWHQTYIPSRSGSIYDVALDTSAAVCVQLGLFIILRHRMSRAAQPLLEPAIEPAGDAVIR